MGQLNAELNYNVKAELNTTPNAAQPTWSDLGVMMKNISQAINEVLYQASYLSDGGYGSTEVTGGQYTVTLTGDKKVGDPVSDYIFNPDVQYKWGSARKTQLRLVKGTQTIIWNVTLANITDAGGDSNQPNAVTLTIHGNGKPIIGTVADDTSSKLKSLSIGALVLNPAFGNGQYGYTASTSNASDIVTAEAEAVGGVVAIALDGVAVVNGEAAAWALGQNILVITVTNGTNVSTYTVVVTKTA